MKKLNWKSIVDKPKILLLIFLIVTFIVAPLIITVILHIVNIIGSFIEKDFNPDGINNAIWVGFFGSFIGGACTLVAVIYTLKSNKETLQKTLDSNKIALEQSQRQSIYQAEREHILAEQKLLSEVISNMQPFIVTVFCLKYQNILNKKDYDITKACELITEIQNFSIKLQTDFERQRIESTIMNRCDIDIPCIISQLSKYYAYLYWNLYNEMVALLNKKIQLITDRNNFNYKIEKGYKLDIEGFFRKFDSDVEKVGKEINAFTLTFPSKSAKLVWLSGEFITEKQKIIMEDLNGINRRKCIASKWDGEKRDETFEKVKKEIDDLLENDKDIYPPMYINFDT